MDSSSSNNESEIENQDVESNVQPNDNGIDEIESGSSALKKISVTQNDLENFSSQMIVFDFFLLSLSIFLLLVQIFELGVYFCVGYFMGITMLRISLNTPKMCVKSTSGWIGIIHLNIENIGFVGSAVRTSLWDFWLI